MFGRFIISLFLLSTVNVSNGCLCCTLIDNNFLKQNSGVFEYVGNRTKVSCKGSSLNIFGVFKQSNKEKHLKKKCFCIENQVILYNDMYITNMSDLSPPII